MKLSYRQTEALKELVRAQPDGLRKSCTNLTMCALENRGLAEYVGADLWRATPKGLKEMPPAKAARWFETTSAA